MRKNRVINQGFTRSRKFRVDIMYIIYDNMITSRNMNFLIMATTEPLSLFVGGAICRVESDFLSVSHVDLINTMWGWVKTYYYQF